MDLEELKIPDGPESTEDPKSPESPEGLEDTVRRLDSVLSFYAAKHKIKKKYHGVIRWFLRSLCDNATDFIQEKYVIPDLVNFGFPLDETQEIFKKIKKEAKEIKKEVKRSEKLSIVHFPDVVVVSGQKKYFIGPEVFERLKTEYTGTDFEKDFHDMLTRYEVFGATYQVYLPRELLQTLRDRFCVTIEGFSSPFFNVMPRYGSMFKENLTGSLGNFFMLEPEMFGGAFMEVNPPFLDVVIEKTWEKIKKFLNSGIPFAFLLVLPVWDHLEVIEEIRNNAESSLRFSGFFRYCSKFFTEVLFLSDYPVEIFFLRNTNRFQIDFDFLSKTRNAMH